MSDDGFDSRSADPEGVDAGGFDAASGGADWPAAIDADAYIAAVRAGAVDPYGQSADELQGSLDAYDREWTARLLALSDVELDAVVTGRMAVPQLPGPVESERTARLRAEAAYVGRVRALEVQAARLEAAKRELLADRFARLLAEPGSFETNLREAASVLAVELHLSDRAIERRMTDAWQTVTELPLAHDAHRAGRITASHLRAIVTATEALRLDAAVEPEQRALVEQELVAVAETTTPGQLRSRARRIVDRVLTAPLQQRYETASQQRAVSLHDAGDGMVDLCARVPAALGAAAFARLTDAARGKAKDDPRSFEQFRADAYLELLLTGHTPQDLAGVNGIAATIIVTIPATALLHDDADRHDGNDGADGTGNGTDGRGGDAAPGLRFPAMLEGDILVDTATVRSLAADTITWERLFLDPVTGVPVTVDTYRPSRAMRRWLRRRDGHCRWPGCSNRVSSTDLDHTQDWADGGPTTLSNLASLCRRHHTMKHATRWTVQQLEDGILEWTSPLGTTLHDEPQPQGPRFTNTSHDDTPWGTPTAAEPNLANAPPVTLPF
ncbi:HNH endonuclease signature motif containing protein [Agrococcus sp. Marseille-P2731]|uniref:HNH endonuclease signature motif containing protein n=1 Tax=Agrococcus sp. Marseille-P2731 TaxID=1841862 RepID=UPI000930228D|nr:HNH endonuclease signature motif containing protein [Agrococcus sp. Marseille-P2731]